MTDPRQKSLFDDDLFAPFEEDISKLDSYLDDIRFDDKFDAALKKILSENEFSLDEPDFPDNFYNQLKSINHKQESKEMPKVGWNEFDDGTRKCYNNAGQIHSDVGPAEIRANGSELYYKNGKLHRDGGLPAMVTPGGTSKFVVDGKYHRAGGLPAICWGGGGFQGRENEWWVNGELKKVEYTDGTMRYFAPGCYDKANIEFHPLHREDGPAVEYANGIQEYWLNGTQYVSQQDWLNALTNVKTTVKNTTKVTADKKEEKTMSNAKPSFGDMVKSNGVAAAYRVGATQSTKAIKSGLVQAMKAKGGDNSHAEAFSAFLDTELGEAIISMALGVGLNYMPGIGQDTRVQRLAEEMRIGGMALAGNTIIGEAVTYIVPALQQVISKLPEAETNAVRVHTNETSSRLAEVMAEEDEAEEAATVVEMKKMKA